jgi:hypothetical protein
MTSVTREALMRVEPFKRADGTTYYRARIRHPDGFRSAWTFREALRNLCGHLRPGLAVRLRGTRVAHSADKPRGACQSRGAPFSEERGTLDNRVEQVL